MNDYFINNRLANFDIRNIESEVKRERQNYKLTLRKKKINDSICLRRNFIFRNELNFTNKNSDNGGIKIKELNIEEKYKSEIFISKIINEESTKEIFIYINQLYNFTNSYNEHLLKYGLYLLNRKLSDDNVDRSKINIGEIIQNGFYDIALRILEYSKKEIETKDENDEFLLEIYQIMISFSFYANFQENSKLISSDFLILHNFFLKNSSNDNIITNIIFLLSNLCLDSYYYGNIIFSHESIFTQIELYAESAIGNNKKNLINVISCLYNSFLFSFYSFYKENNYSSQCCIINYKILESIYSILKSLINVVDCFSDCIWGIARLLKIVLKDNIRQFFSFLIESNKLIITLLNEDYSKRGDYLYPFCKIIKYFFIGLNNIDLKDESIKSNALMIFNYLLNDAMIIDFMAPLLREKFTPKITGKMLSTLTEMSKNYKFARCIAENHIIKIIINCLDSSNYKVKKGTLVLIEALSCQSIQVSSILVNNGVFTKMLNMIEPDYGIVRNLDITILSLRIIWNIFEKGNMISMINGRNSFTDKFEDLGGKQIIEKLLENPNKDVYIHAEKIQKKFFNDEV